MYLIRNMTLGTASELLKFYYDLTRLLLIEDEYCINNALFIENLLDSISLFILAVLEVPFSISYFIVLFKDFIPFTKITISTF